jgi:hypothetical protein
MVSFFWGAVLAPRKLGRYIPTTQNYGYETLFIVSELSLLSVQGLFIDAQ